MPTGHFIRYQSESDFKPSICHRTGLLAMQWLEWVAADKQVQIQHTYNGGEVRIGPRQLPVDGYCAESRTVFQFHGCWYHGHHCAYKTDKNRHTIHPVLAGTVPVLRTLSRRPDQLTKMSRLAFSQPG